MNLIRNLKNRKDVTLNCHIENDFEQKLKAFKDNKQEIILKTNKIFQEVYYIEEGITVNEVKTSLTFPDDFSIKLEIDDSFIVLNSQGKLQAFACFPQNIDIFIKNFLYVIDLYYEKFKRRPMKDLTPKEN